MPSNITAATASARPTQARRHAGRRERTGRGAVSCGIVGPWPRGRSVRRCSAAVVSTSPAPRCRRRCRTAPAGPAACRTRRTGRRRSPRAGWADRAPTPAPLRGSRDAAACAARRSSAAATTTPHASPSAAPTTSSTSSIAQHGDAGAVGDHPDGGDRQRSWRSAGRTLRSRRRSPENPAAAIATAAAVDDRLGDCRVGDDRHPQFGVATTDANRS